MLRIGRFMTRRGWQRAVGDDPYGGEIAQWFGNYDVLITPTLAGPAVPVGKWRGAGWVATTLGSSNWLCTPPWNLAGVPAMSIPGGMSSHGMPLGLQLVAPVGHEQRLLAVAAQLETLNPWPTWEQ
jgi:amidase